MTTSTRLGYVVDFCPICVRAQACLLEEVHGAPAQGEDALIEHQRTCTTCKIAALTERHRYVGTADTAGNLYQLELKTFPDLQQAHQARLELERQLARDPAQVSAELRRQLLLEPLQLLSAHLTARPQPPATAYLNTHVKPLLRRTLARIVPQREEVADVLRQLSAQGVLIADHVQVEDLLPAVPGTDAPPAVEAASEQALPVSSRSPRPEHAALIFKFCGWLVVGLLAVVVLGFSEWLDDGAFALIFSVLIGLAIALFFGMASGIKLRAGWARVTGMLMGAAFLVGFPIGTIIGGYVIYCLAFHWQDGAAAD